MEKAKKVLEELLIAARASISPEVRECPNTGVKPSRTHLMLCRTCRQYLLDTDRIGA